MTPQQDTRDATLLRFDGSTAVLRFPDGREVRATLAPSAQESLARELLNQLLSER